MKWRFDLRKTKGDVVRLITDLHEKTNLFFGNFYTLDNCEAPLASISRVLGEYRVTIDSALFVLSPTIIAALRKYYDDTYGNIRLWKRRVTGTATIEEWQKTTRLGPIQRRGVSFIC